MLLHIGDAARWTTVDPLLVVGAGLGFLAALAAVWSPTFRGRRFRRALARGVMLAAMLVAILPSVLPYDHLFPADVHAGSDETHAAHCHTAPGSCSDAPLPAGSGQFLMSDPLVAVPVLTSFAILLVIPLLAGISTRPGLRPPLSAC
jgi:hypothetical protein